MKTYRGGCAVMLDLPRNAIEPIKVAALGDEPLHATLLFVGRDLGFEQAAAVVNVALLTMSGRGSIPIRFTGQLEFFKTSKGRYLVALLDPEPLLGPRRAFMETLSGVYGVSTKDGFAFKPHVTLTERPVSPASMNFQPFEVPCGVARVKYGSCHAQIELT